MASVDETSTAVNQISLAIEQVTRNLDHLAGIVRQSASAMEEINSTIGNVEQNAAISHEVSSQVKSQAEESIAVVTETIAFPGRDPESRLKLSYEAIKRLAENSTRIENIVNVINDITKRTNLLALNASIIAAQAGEYGKSFSVVADEIRNLSLQTGRSTGEITGIIEEIMSESQTAAGNITSTKSLVQRGVDWGTPPANRSKPSLIARSFHGDDPADQACHRGTGHECQMVAKSMEDISSMTTQIFTASTDQATATRSIARAIEAIKEMAHEMVRSTSRQVEDSGRIRNSVESVGGMVVEMFDNMEKRRAQSAEVVKELESMKGLTCQI